ADAGRHLSARLTSRLKPSSENAARELLTLFCSTSSLPCCTSTSVMASERTSRLETVTRCTRGLVARCLDQRFVVDAHRLRQQGDAERGLQQGPHENLPFRRLGAVLRKTIFDNIYAAMPSSWNTPRMAVRSAS